MGDVTEILNDGTSGLVSGGVTGCLVVGSCSKGEANKPYVFGKGSKIEDSLGVGTLTDRIKNIFQAGGQNPKVIAVPAGATPAELPGITKSREDSPAVTISGASKSNNDIVIKITTAGELNIGTFQISYDKGISFSENITLPVDSNYILAETGVTVNFPAGSYEINDTYSFSLKAPSATLQDIIAACKAGLELYEVEFVYVTGATDGTAWISMQALAEEMFNKHRPVYFKCEARLPEDDEDLQDWVTYLKEERKDVSARFVQVCAAYGNITDSDGNTKLSNLAGIQAGRVLSIPVQRATGRVKDGSLTGVTLPDNWDSAIGLALIEEKFLIAKTYAGLSGVYWDDSYTLAESTSDYQYEEVVRVVFKGVRLARQAALKSMYDELGDPNKPEDMTGANELRVAIETAFDTMKDANPKEIAGYEVVIPEGQDFVNNGVAVEYTLIGIPIIRKITLHASYTYAGSNFDPRLN